MENRSGGVMDGTADICSRLSESSPSYENR
jgi:hypothetical protein